MSYPARVTRSATLALFVLVTGLAGCDDDDGFVGGTGPDGAGQLTRDITFGEFEQQLQSGAQRIEVELLPGGPPLVARELEVEAMGDVDEEDEIETRIVDPGFRDLVVNGSCEGGLVLALAGPDATFDAATRFEIDELGEVDCATFVAEVEAALTAGREPAVEVERDPPTTPQDPDLPGFAALEVELEDDDEPRTKIELEIDGDNLFDCETLTGAPAGCVGVLRVLATSIAIVDGVTEIEAENPDLAGQVEFEGIVGSVDLDADSPTFTLASGTTVRVLEGTRIEAEEEEGEEMLASLAAVDAALEDGLVVEAEGEATPAEDDASILEAIEVEFELED